MLSSLTDRQFNWILGLLFVCLLTPFVVCLVYEANAATMVPLWTMVAATGIALGLLVVLWLTSLITLAQSGVAPSPSIPKLGAVAACSLSHEDEDCVICCTADPTLSWSVTPCGHTFHTVCVLQWFRKQVTVLGTGPTCPLCRAAV